MAPKRKAPKSLPAATIAVMKKEVKEDVPEEENVAEEKPDPSAKKAKVEVTPQKSRRKKKAKTTPAKKGAEKPAAKSKPEPFPKSATPKGTTKAEATASRSSKLIIIEASKECNSFKVRATKVETDLKKIVPVLEVKINPEKPRKGCFEIRDDAGTVFLSLQNMPRPYSKMKNLDLDKTIAEIAEKIK